MLTRRLALGATAGLAMPSLARSSGTPINVVYGAFPPYTVADPARPGIVNEVAREVLRMVGREPVFQPMEWADAQARGRSDANTLITPLGRTAAREPNYTWIVKVIDLGSSVGTLAPNPALDLDGARRVARLGVHHQSYHEAFLRAQGFTNLVTVPVVRAMDALIAGEIDAFYTQSLELAWYAKAKGRAADLRLGPQLQSVGAFLATSRAAEGVPVQAIQEAFAAVESEGTIDRIVRAYMG